jgi:Helix-turn-helix domain
MHPAPKFDDDLDHSKADKPKYMRGPFLWLQQVATDRTLPPMAASLAIVLAGYVNQRSGDAWPTQETLANAVAVNIRSVRRTIAELVERGHLEVVSSRGWHRPNSYRPIWKDRTATPGLDPSRPDSSVRSSARKTGHLDPQDRTSTPSRPDIWRQLDRTARPSRIIERTIEGTIDTRADARESDCPDRDLLGDQQPITPQRSATTRRRATPKVEPEGFDEFYRVYPRQVARGAAENAYKRIIANGAATPAEMHNGAMRYAAERTGEPERFTKHPATWLNGQCWKDAPAASAGRTSSNVEKLMAQCGLGSFGFRNREIGQ